MTRFEGRCHCGNIAVAFETRRTAATLPVRACGCGFCRRHGMRATSDPDGRLAIAIRDPDRASRYRFGLKTADFLVCAVCGVYVAAVMAEGGAAWATLNVNILDDAIEFTGETVSVDYGGESGSGRRARRRARWTPAEVRP